ncbi:MAG: signal recognition particle-docking protein FtsY [Candidatus Marinimicrobia bacterium]|nr:signal recognition particle-docking protein FtsY [Candidatus Neomarinimicrobiota bacterium]
MKSIFQSFVSGLSKTRNKLRSTLSSITDRGKIGEQEIEEIEAALIQTDMGVDMAAEIMESVRERMLKGISSDEVYSILAKEVQSRLKVFEWDDEIGKELHSKPHVILVVGVNGSGKTTTVGKLAAMHSRFGRNVLIAAADTYRAAAAEQLEIWSKRAGVDIVKSVHGAEPASVGHDALLAAKARGVDVLIVDSAGRLHTKTNLMEELKKISRVMEKIDPAAPHEILLTLDSNNGQNALLQAKEFGKAVGVTGLVLTKLDGTAKGGIVLSINNELDIPVKYIGIGEEVEDLEPFEVEAFASSLFYEEDNA